MLTHPSHALAEAGLTMADIAFCPLCADMGDCEVCDVEPEPDGGLF